MEKKVIKVTAKQLQTIISEEATRYRKVLETKRTLEEKKASIISQLNEMYEASEVNEIMGEAGVDEGFLGIMGAEEKARKQNLEKQFDALIAQGAIGDKAAFLQKAANDNFGGALSSKPAGGANPKFAGKNIINYTPNPTTMQKLAAGTGAVTGGGGTGAKQAPL